MQHLRTIKVKMPRRLLVLAALGAGLLMTALLALTVHRYQQRQIESMFTRDAMRIVAQMQTRLSSHFEALQAVKGLYAANATVSRKQFQSFLHELDLIRNHPGFQAVQFVRHVPGGALQQFIDEVRHDTSLRPDGYPQFDIRPHVPRDDHYVVEFTEPFTGNEKAFGIDLAALPPHLKAVELGRDTGKAVASEKVKLVQDTAGRAAFVVRDPIYRNGQPHDTVEQRRAALLGFAAMVYRVDDLMRESIEPHFLSSMVIRVYDAGFADSDTLTPHSSASLLFDSGQPDLQPTHRDTSGLTTQGALEIGERLWQFEFAATRHGRYAVDNDLMLGVLLAGSVISVLLATLVSAWSRRRTLSQQLEARVAEQKAIFDNAAVGIEFVRDRVIQSCNVGLARMLGYRTDELIGRSTRILFSSDEAYDAVGRIAYEAMMAGQSWIGEIDYQHRDGHLIPCRFHGKYIDQERQELGSIWVCYDISAQRQADIALQHAQSQMIHSEKLASLGQLVASVAHEINTPIGAIKASGGNIHEALELALVNLPKVLQLLDAGDQALFMRLCAPQADATQLMSTREERALLREVARLLEQEGIPDPLNTGLVLVQLHAQAAMTDYLPLLRHPQRAFILETAASVGAVLNNTNNINTAVERVAKIVFALKAYSRVDQSGAMTLAPLAEGLDTVLTLYQGQFKDRIQLVRQYQSVPPLLCRPDELNQVWTNLVHNALQAMPQQGTLTVTLRQAGPNAEVSVADTGCGIPPALRERIFEPFFTTKPRGEGSGLGLDIVKTIVERHDGHIKVDSEEGVGTTFTVVLPIKAAP